MEKKKIDNCKKHMLTTIPTIPSPHWDLKCPMFDFISFENIKLGPHCFLKNKIKYQIIYEIIVIRSIREIFSGTYSQSSPFSVYPAQSCSIISVKIHFNWKFAVIVLIGLASTARDIYFLLSDEELSQTFTSHIVKVSDMNNNFSLAVTFDRWLKS